MPLRHDYFVYAVLCMLAGASVYFTHIIEVDLWLAFGSAALLAVVWLVRRHYIAWLIFAFVFGFAYAQGHYAWTAQKPRPDFPAYAKEYTIKGVVEWAHTRPNGGSLDFIVGRDKENYKLRLYTTHDAVAVLQPGCGATLTADIESMPHPLLPDGYDVRFVSFYEGIVGRGFLREIKNVDCQRPLHWTHRLSRLRLAIANRFIESLPSPQGSVAAALVTGVRARIPSDIRDLFRDSGLAHMLAISGLHMALFAGTFFGLLRLLAAFFPRLAEAYNIRKYSAAAALLAALSYLAISGMSYATQRAFIMIALIFVAIFLGRRALTFRNIAWAAFFVVLLHPPAVMQAGFQMSFIAVVALVSFYDGVWQNLIRNEDEGRMLSSGEYGVRLLWRYVLGLSMTSLIAGAATGFIALYHFKQIGAFGLLTNLAAMPIFGLVSMPMAFPAVVLMPLRLEVYPMLIMGASIDAIIDVARYITSFQGAVLRVGGSPVWVLPLGMAGILLLCMMRNKLWWLSAPMIILALAFIGRAEQPLLYIYGNGQVIAAQDEGGNLRHIKGRPRSFEMSIWARAHGQTADDIKSYDCTNNKGKGRKDCLVIVKNGVRILYRPNMQSCAVADIIIAPYEYYDETCAALVIDKRTMTRNRTLIVWDREGGLVVEELVSAY
ncbi:MAG: ComEC family competence protein [Alphaproteobacteria bacterium]|nr:ComEC family competence protein [Alphaproteobacteria bacterium]